MPLVPPTWPSQRTYVGLSGGNLFRRQLPLPCRHNSPLLSICDYVDYVVVSEAGLNLGACKVGCAHSGNALAVHSMARRTVCFENGRAIWCGGGKSTELSSPH